MTVETIGKDDSGRAQPGVAPGLRCNATTAAGEPCQNVGGPEGFCSSHVQDPQARILAKVAGTVVGSLPKVRVGLDLNEETLDLDAVEGVIQLMGRVIVAVGRNRITTGQAGAITAAARLALDASSKVTRARLEELQAKLAEMHEARRGAR